MRYIQCRELNTPRLHLRRFRISDWEAHHRHITSDSQVARAMLWQANPDPAHAREVIRKIVSRYDTRDGYRWAIIRKEDDAYMGTISLLRIDEAKSSCSFAYMLGSAFWNRGYMTEALAAVLEFAFTDMQMQFVEADHFADNAASGAVMAKVGMEYGGMAPGKYEKEGVMLDAARYTITREKWIKRMETVK